MWLSGLRTSLWTKMSPVWFPVRAHTWVASQVPSWGCVRSYQLCISHPSMFLYLSFSLLSSLSKNKLIKCLKKRDVISWETIVNQPFFFQDSLLKSRQNNSYLKHQTGSIKLWALKSTSLPYGHPLLWHLQQTLWKAAWFKFWSPVTWTILAII